MTYTTRRNYPPKPPHWAATVAIIIAFFVGLFVLAQDARAAAKTSTATCYALNGRTASGTWVDRRTAAHDFLWPGTRFRIVGRQAGPGGIRKYVVRDTGPALSDGHFDLWSPSESTCIQFGRRTIRWRLGW